MYYLSRGLQAMNLEKLGKVLAIIFAILCIGASFGGGNAFQSNQAAVQISNLFDLKGGGCWCNHCNSFGDFSRNSNYWWD